MIRINLLGHEPTRAARSRAMPELSVGGDNAGFILAVVGTIVVLAAAWYYQSSTISDLRAARAAAQAEFDELADTADRVREVQDRTALITQKLDVIVELKRNQSGPVMLLDQISRMLPDSLWLTQMNVDAGAVQIMGGALSQIAVTDFLEALRLSPDFADQTLRFTEDTGDAVRFQLDVRFVPLTARPAAPADSAAAGAGAPGS